MEREKAKIFLNPSKGLGQINTDESYDDIISLIEDNTSN